MLSWIDAKPFWARRGFLVVLAFAVLTTALIQFFEAADPNARLGETAVAPAPAWFGPSVRSYLEDAGVFQRAIASSERTVAYLRTIPAGQPPVVELDRVRKVVDELRQTAGGARLVSLDFLVQVFPQGGETTDFLGRPLPQLSEVWLNGFIPGTEGIAAYYQGWLDDPAGPPDRAELAAAQGYLDRFQNWYQANRARVLRGTNALIQPEGNRNL